MRDDVGDRDQVVALGVAPHHRREQVDGRVARGHVADEVEDRRAVAVGPAGGAEVGEARVALARQQHPRRAASPNERPPTDHSLEVRVAPAHRRRCRAPASPPWRPRRSRSRPWRQSTSVPSGSSAANSTGRRADASQIASGLRITLDQHPERQERQPEDHRVDAVRQRQREHEQDERDDQPQQGAAAANVLNHVGLQEVGEDQREALGAEHQVLDRDALVADVREPRGARAVDERVGDAGALDDEPLVVAAGRDQDPRLQAEVADRAAGGLHHRLLLAHQHRLGRVVSW